MIDSDEDVQSAQTKPRRTHPKSQFSKAEDKKLAGLVRFYGEGKWDLISKAMGNRNERQCKERWTKYLSPDINNSPWTIDEELLLVSLYKQFGGKWVKMSKFFNNRTDAALKNRWGVIARRDKLKKKSKYDERPVKVTVTQKEINQKSKTELDFVFPEMFDSFDFPSDAILQQ